MLPLPFYAIALFMPIWLVLCGTKYSHAKRHDRSDATALASSDDILSGDSDRLQSLTMWYNVVLDRCGHQRHIVRGYTYNFTVAKGENSTEINFAFSQALAYHQTMQQRILNRNTSNKHFNLKGFPHAYNITFPPQILFSCYEILISWGVRKIATPTTQLKKIYKLPVPDSLTKTSHAYFTQRRNMYERIELYTKVNSDNPAAYLYSNCQKYRFTKITELINDLIKDDPLHILTPTFNKTELYASVKMFISDMIIYEIIQQACTAVEQPQPKVTQNDWDTILDKLKKADSKITISWSTQLENLELPPTDISDLSFVGKFNKRLSDRLNEKYFWNVFRVHLYRDLPGKTVDIMCTGRERTRCIKRNDAFAVVTWKEMSWDEDIAVSNAPLSARAAARLPYFFDECEVAKESPKFLKPRLAATAEHISRLVHPLDDLTFSGQLLSSKGLDDKDPSEKVVRWQGVAGDTSVESSLKNMLNVANTIAKYAGPLAASVSAALSTFEDNHIPNVLAEMNAKFVEMHDGHFDRLDCQMQFFKRDISAVVKKLTVNFNIVVEMREFPKHINKLKTKLREYRNTNAAPAATYLDPLKTMFDQCKIWYNPYPAVEVMHEAFVGKEDFKRDILHQSQPDRLALLVFLTYRAHELIDLHLHTMECSLYRYFYIQAVGGTMTRNDVIQELSLIEGGQAMALEQLREIRYAMLKFDNEQLYGWQPHLHALLTEKYNQEWYLSVNIVKDAGKIAYDLKNFHYWWNDFSVTIFKSWWPNETIPGLDEPTFFERFFINPDYSAVHVVPGFEHLKWNLYMIVNWGVMKKTQPDLGSLRFTTNVYDTCGMKGDEYGHHLQGQAMRSLFIWRTYTGVALTHLYEHPAGQHASVSAVPVSTNIPPWDPQIRMAENSCCGFGGHLPIAKDERNCWLRHRLGRTTAECLSHMYKNVRACHRDHAMKVMVVGNFGEGY